MTYQPDYIEALKELGYTQREAEFLYISAHHSGYFLQRQFDRFAIQEGSRTSGEFVKKAVQKQHVRPHTFARNAKLYDIYSRRVYNALRFPNCRNRKSHSLATIKVKLLSLQFILLNPQHSYLETEQQRVDYFTQIRKINKGLLPTTIYRSADNKSSTTRYFVDRFPIFLPADGDENTPLTFTYIDDTTTSIQSFHTHLNRYLPLLRALNNFHFVFVSTDQLKFDSAERYFHARVNANEVCEQSNFANDLIRYFTLRQQWEDPKQRRALTQEQILFLSAAKHAYSNSIHEQQYNEWKITKRLVLPEVQSSPRLTSFSTFLVEDKFQLLSG